MTLTKNNLALEIAGETGFQSSSAYQIVDIIFRLMREKLMNGDRVEIRGFGTFEVKETKPKPSARNPRTGAVIYVPARRKITFRPGKILKEALKEPHALPEHINEESPVLSR